MRNMRSSSYEDGLGLELATMICQVTRSLQRPEKALDIDPDCIGAKKTLGHCWRMEDNSRERYTILKEL